MTVTKIIEGVGFGATGYESDYLVLFDGEGKDDFVSATAMVPEDARASACRARCVEAEGECVAACVSEQQLG